MQNKCGIIKLSLHKTIYLAFYATLYISKYNFLLAVVEWSLAKLRPNVTWAVHQIIHLGMSSLGNLAASVKLFESLCSSVIQFKLFACIEILCALLNYKAVLKSLS